MKSQVPAKAFRTLRSGQGEWVVHVWLAAVLLMSWASTAPGEVLDSNMWGTDGDVVALARAGSTVYLAGSFRSVGPNSGGGIPTSSWTGRAQSGYAKVTGTVAAVVADGAGGWYIGGAFSAVGGQPRTGLAHIMADGRVGSWAPQIENTADVVSLVLAGRVLYVGGGFRTVNGQQRNHLAAFDARRGGLLPWNPNADGNVFALAEQAGTVYVAGEFYTMGGKARCRLAALDGATGAVTNWDPGADSEVRTLAVHGSTVYVGGYFRFLGGADRRLIGAVDARTGVATEWDPGARGPRPDYAAAPHIEQIALHGSTVYAAGLFDSIGGKERGGVAAVDASTGVATDWAPTFGPHYEGYAPPPCNAVAVRGETVYVGGSFGMVNKEPRERVAALDVTTGALTDWDPRVNGVVNALAVERGTVYVGGEIRMIGDWRHRAGLAALDSTTGAVKPWNPNPDGVIVTALAVHGGRVFVSGDFADIGGQPRDYFAALDTVNGEATDWNPGGNGVATEFLLQGDTLYAGGYFTRIGGQSRSYLAAIAATTGQVTDWDPQASWPVLAMARSENTVYIGGLFNHVGSQLRRGIAAVDAPTGQVTAWNPDTDYGVIDALLVSGHTVYVGGVFNQIGGQPRRSLAALDATTGAAMEWDPAPTERELVYPRIYAMALGDSFLYVGGDFSSIGGKPRTCLAAIDIATGRASAWDPDADGLVWTLSAGGNSVYAGGGFTTMAGLPCSGVAAFSGRIQADQRPPRCPPLVAFLPIVPNPVRGHAIARFATSAAAAIDLTVFDVMGRRVSTYLDHEVRPAGVYEVAISTEGWPAGVYYCRLLTGSSSAMQHLLVLR